MVTREIIERYRDSYEAGLTVDEYVEFFHDCIQAAPEDEVLSALTDEELRELAEAIIELNEA